MLSPLPRRSGWAYCFAHSPSRISLPRKGRRVGLRIVLFEACSTFTRVTACTLALSPIRDTHSEGFSYFVTSIAAPAASGWSVCRVGLAPTGKRRLVTAHTRNGHFAIREKQGRVPTRQARLVAQFVIQGFRDVVLIHFSTVAALLGQTSPCRTFQTPIPFVPAQVLNSDCATYSVVSVRYRRAMIMPLSCAGS